MVRRCVVGGCSNTNAQCSLHEFPRDENVRKKWDKFVSSTRKDWKRGISTSMVCAQHFQAPTDFVGYHQWRSGFRKKLDLVPGAVPTIRLPLKAEAQSSGRRAVKKLSIARIFNPIHVASSSTSNKTEISSTKMKKICFGSLHGKTVQSTYTIRSDLPSGTEEAEETTVSIHLDCGDNLDKESLSNSTTSACTGTQVHDSVLINPIKTSRGTQLGMRRESCRSIGIQVNVDSRQHRSDTGTQWEFPLEDNEDLSTSCLYTERDSYVNTIQEDVIVPEQSEEPETQLDRDPAHEEEKFLVFKYELLQLFQFCRRCHFPVPGTLEKRLGTCIHIKQKCSKCSYIYNWSSQPFIGKMPVGNLLLSGSILFSGCLSSKCLLMFKLLNMACIGRSTFFRHQQHYLFPTIIRHWENAQESIIAELTEQNTGLVLAGDGRSDSPGHCAKYGAFTFIEMKINKVLDIQQVQSNEVPNSSWCEHEGLKRSIQHLTDQGLSVETIVTDRHRQNNKWIRENLPNTNHFYDIWHVSKSTGKKLDTVAKLKDCEVVGQWKQSIINHMYWSAGSTADNNGEVIGAKWESVIQHIQNKHTDHPNPLFQQCMHEPLEAEDVREIQWLDPNSKAFVEVEKILLNKNLLKDIARLSSQEQTSCLEAFHSLILHFAPKNTCFSYLGMLCRLYLAGLHYNANSGRDQHCNQNGEACFSVRYPKARKGQAVVRPDKTKPTYSYAENLMKELLEGYAEGPGQLRASIQNIRARVPGPLSSNADRPDKRAAVEAFVSRYNR